MCMSGLQAMTVTLPPVAAVVRPADPHAAIAAAASTASAFFTRLGVTAAEGNAPIPMRYDPSVADAAYRATVTLGADGSRTRSDEHVLIGNDPFTGRPFSSSPDVIYHELTHRINEHLVPGIGSGTTSRMVDESIADTFAAAIDGNWTLGESLVPGGLRSMQDPSRQQMLRDGVREPVETPSRCEQITSDSIDRGPYFNIGPMNHAAYLIGTKLGTDPMAKIYLQALRAHLQPAATMTDLVMGTIRGAVDLYGASSVEQAAVRDAWKAVGVRAGAVDAV